MIDSGSEIETGTSDLPLPPSPPLHTRKVLGPSYNVEETNAI